jgi:hypothetical protein
VASVSSALASVSQVWIQSKLPPCAQLPMSWQTLSECDGHPVKRSPLSWMMGMLIFTAVLAFTAIALAPQNAT